MRMLTRTTGGSIHTRVRMLAIIVVLMSDETTALHSHYTYIHHEIIEICVYPSSALLALK